MDVVTFCRFRVLPAFCLAGVRAAPGSVSGGGAAAGRRGGGLGRVSASGRLQAAAVGVQPPGSPAESPAQRQPGRRPVRPEGGLNRSSRVLTERSTWTTEAESFYHRFSFSKSFLSRFFSDFYLIFYGRLCDVPGFTALTLLIIFLRFDI